MSQYRFGLQSESYYYLAEQERPTFNDIQDSAEAGIRRGIGRYLFSRNPERSIKMYTYFGIPLLRKAIMGTYGRFFPRGPMGNYRTDPSKTMIERSMRFSVGGSVVNEAIHTAAALPEANEIMNNMVEGKSPGQAVFWVGLNTALIGLQRYNRSRMTIRMNEELVAGRTFDPFYKNWLGIDGRAMDNYLATLMPQAPEKSPKTSEPLREMPSTSEAPQPVAVLAMHG